MKIVFYLQKKMKNLLYKNIFVLSFLFIYSISTTAYAASITSVQPTELFPTVDAMKNARIHSNMGNLYMQEKNYSSALSEYEIALKLAYDKPISSTYLYNIAQCLYKMGYYNDSKKSVEAALKKDFMNIAYYELLVDCYIKLNEENKQLKKLLQDSTNPYNRIVAGLIYLKTGKKRNAKIIFDEFVCNNPDMDISLDIKQILNQL